MSQFKQTLEGDFDISNNKWTLVDGQEATAQRLSQNLKTYLEEWFLDVTIGLPYLQLIFVKGTPASVITDFIKAEILGTIGVTGLKSFDPLDLDSKTRKLSTKFETTTSFGDVALQESLP